MYYKTQPTTYNQRQHYCHDRRTQQAPFKTDYDREKVEKRFNIHSGISSPDMKTTRYYVGK